MMDSIRVLVVEDDRAVFDRMARSLSNHLGESVQIDGELDFDNALSRLEREHYDLVVLDVRRGDPDRPPVDDGPEAGRVCFEAIRQRRFIPIIFHTGLPGAVTDLTSALVRVVPKDSPPRKLPETVKEVLDSGLPRIARGVLRHVEKVQRDYMWDFVAQHWDRLSGEDVRDLAHLIARRLALSFDAAAVLDLLASLPGPGSAGTITAKEGASESDRLHPVRMYVMPPLLPDAHNMGDLYKGEGELEGIWVLLTPSCDLASEGGRKPKVTEAVLARCFPLVEQSEYKEWKEAGSNKTKERLEALLSNNRRDAQAARYFFLPGVFDLPHLVVDLATLRGVPLARLGAMEHMASLDAPFAAALLTSFQRYFGRFGTADLDVETVISRL